MDQFALSFFDTVAEGCSASIDAMLTHAPKSQDLLFSFKLSEKETGMRPGKILVIFRRALCRGSGCFLRLDVVSLSSTFQGLAMRSGPRESVVRAVTRMNRVKVVGDMRGR